MVGLDERQHPVAAGGAGCAACLDWPNERGAPVWRVAPALSLSLWRRMPVISRPLSESILGSRATRASTERTVSLSVSPHSCFFFFFFPLICFIPVLDLSLPFLHHPWVTFVTPRVVSWPNSNELFPQSQNCTGLRNWIHNGCFFFFLIRSFLWVKWFSFIWSALWHIFTYLLCGLLTHGCSCEERAGV